MENRRGESLRNQPCVALTVLLGFIKMEHGLNFWKTIFQLESFERFLGSLSKSHLMSIYFFFNLKKKKASKKGRPGLAPPVDGVSRSHISGEHILQTNSNDQVWGRRSIPELPPSGNLESFFFF